MSGTLHEDLSMFYCCQWHKFIKKQFCVKLSIFYYLQLHVAQNHIQNALLHFHCNNGYADVCVTSSKWTFHVHIYGAGINVIVWHISITNAHNW
jgi:hypothetical protein